MTTRTLQTPSAGPVGIAATHDGAVWFTEILADKLGRIAADGPIEELPLPEGSKPHAVIAAQSDGVWVSLWGANAIAHVSGDGEFAQIDLPPGSEPHGLALGPDGNLWVALESGAVRRIDGCSSSRRSARAPRRTAPVPRTPPAAAVDGAIDSCCSGESAKTTRPSPERAIAPAHISHGCVLVYIVVSRATSGDNSREAHSASLNSGCAEMSPSVTTVLRSSISTSSAGPDEQRAVRHVARGQRPPRTSSIARRRNRRS